MTDLFGVRGRAWLGSLELPPDERLTVDAALRIDAVLCEQVAAADHASRGVPGRQRRGGARVEFVAIRRHHQPVSRVATPREH